MEIISTFYPGVIDKVFYPDINTRISDIHTAPDLSTYTAFGNGRKLAAGSLEQVVTKSKPVRDSKPDTRILIFKDGTGEQTDVDLSGPLHAILAYLPGSPAIPQPKAGRPKLGVVAKEVTLLPRHWEWLSSQPGGASVTLRKLVENAKRSAVSADPERSAREACYRFISAAAGDLLNIEQASRQLFAGEINAFTTSIAKWPKDIRTYAGGLLSHRPEDEN